MIELWMASFLGAGLFFAAGLCASRWNRQRLAETAALERSVAERRLAAASSELFAVRAELESIKAELAQTLTAQRAGVAELDSANSMRQRLEAHLAAARADAAHRADDVRRLSDEIAATKAGVERERDQATRALRRSQAEAARTLEMARAQTTEIGTLREAAISLGSERDELARLLLSANAESDALADRSTAIAAERDDLAIRVEALRAAQSELARASADRRALLDEIRDLRTRVRNEPEPVETAQLRHELVIASELARARADEAGRVRDENVRLRERLSQLEDLAARFDALVAENDELRAEHFLVEPAAKATLEPMPTASSLQQLVQRVSEVRSVRAAVITDELGLVVASTGEYSDVLAAYGRHLADEGQRVRELLPLRTIRELTVHDDRDVTMTVRPLPVADSNLALVTLGVGAEPEDDVRALLTPTLLEGR